MTHILFPFPWTEERSLEVLMEFWRAWSIPASGPEFPQAGLLDSLETLDGEIRISIRVLNVDAPPSPTLSDDGKTSLS